MVTAAARSLPAPRTRPARAVVVIAVTLALAAGVVVALAPPRIPWTLLRFAPLREDFGRGGETTFAAYLPMAAAEDEPRTRSAGKDAVRQGESS